MPPPRRTDHRRSLVFGGALALLFLVGQLSTFTHLLLVRHVTCPQHGELIHLEEAVASAAPALPDDDTPQLAAQRLLASHGHDHCLVCSSRREKPIAQGSMSPAGGASPSQPAQSLSAAGLACSSVALLRLAPKSSPPA